MTKAIQGVLGASVYVAVGYLVAIYVSGWLIELAYYLTYVV